MVHVNSRDCFFRDRAPNVVSQLNTNNLTDDLSINIATLLDYSLDHCVARSFVSFLPYVTYSNQSNDNNPLLNF